jgi:hypothetical protein
MTNGAGFSYVQARIQARHGRRPDESDWSRLESCDSAHAYLEAARTGVFADWAEGLTTEQNIHRLEDGIRHAWRGYLGRVASWSPEPWCEAIEWCGCLPDLPLRAHVAITGERPAWPPERDEAGGTAPETLDAWRDAWHARMPSANAAARDGIRSLEAAVEAWLAANRDAERASVSRSATLRETLERRVITVFRRHALDAAAVFAHLVLTALDLQRFRGGLLRRQALSGRGVAGAPA